MLRPFTWEDLHDVRDMRSHDAVARYLPGPVPTEDEIRAALERKVARRSIEQEGDSLSLAVVPLGSNWVCPIS
jgi:hypothetical protein